MQKEEIFFQIGVKLFVLFDIQNCKKYNKNKLYTKSICVEELHSG